MSLEIIYRLARTGSDFEHGKNLFKEYVTSLGVDLSFQDFENELKTIDRQYNKPAGGLVLVFHKAQAIGCAGIRQLDKETAELKRMFVQETYRGCHIGVELLKRSLQLAKDLGYKKIKLDTLKDMAKAQELYRSFGFYEVPPYRFNPLEGTIYMEKEL